MSDDFDTEEMDSDGIKNLRNELKKLRAENKALAEERQAAAKAARDAGLSKAFEAKGLNPKLASLYNGEDVSEDAVSKWAEEFGFAAAAPAEQKQEAQVDPNAQAAARVNAASFGNDGLSQVGELNSVTAEDYSRMVKALDYDELVRLGILPKQNIFGPAH